MSLQKFWKESMLYRLGGGHAFDHAAMGVPTLSVLAAPGGASLIGASGGSNLQSSISALTTAQASGLIGYSTLSAMNADLAHIAGSVALVTNDASVSNNTYYLKAGASGAGSWVPANTTQLSSEIASRLSFQSGLNFTVGKNLFNLALASIGFYVLNSTGALSANATYAATPFIPVTPSTTYSISENPSNQGAYYDSNYAYISGVGAGTHVTTPAGAAFARFTLTAALINNYQVELGSVNTQYLPYQKTISPTMIPVGAVAPSQTTFFVSSKNLFNPNDAGVATAYYVNYTNGTLGANSTYTATGYIPVAPNATYAASMIAQTAFYDSNKVYISGVAATFSPGSITTPANASYVRFSVNTITALPTFQVELGSSPTAYVPYSLLINPVNLPTLAIPAQYITSSMIGNQQVGTSQIANSAVTPTQTSFFSTGKNLFNPADVNYLLGNYVVYTTGTLLTAASYSVTGYISVLQNTQYSVSLLAQTAFYDSNKVYISGLAGTFSPSTITTPSNAAYARFSIPTAALSTFQVELGSVNTTYAAYQYVINPTFIPTVSIPNNSVTGAMLVNKTVSTINIADSAVTPTQTSFFSTGKNLFNLADAGVTVGFYVTSSNGVLGVNALYTATGYIPVVGSSSYAVSYINQIAFYDVNKIYISGISATYAPGSITTPSNAAYARFTMLVGGVNSFQVEVGTIPTSYSAYQYGINPEYVPTGAPAIGSVTTATLADQSVTPAKISFLLPGKNLYNPLDSGVQAGYYILWSNGVANSNATYTASGYISVSSNTAYAVSWQAQMAFYDSNKVYISGINGTGSANTFTTPSNAAYARFSIPASQSSIFQVELGAFSTAYAAYHLQIDPTYIGSGAAGSVSGGQAVTDIILPTYTYALVGSTAPNNEQFNIYFSNVCQGYISDKNPLVSATPSYGEQYSDCYRLEAGNSAVSFYNTTSGNVSLSLSICDNTMTSIIGATTTITLVNKTTPTTPVRLLCLGDSITRDGSYAKPSYTKLPNVTLQGPRHYDGTGGTDPAYLFREGRGGWTMAQYTSSYGQASGLDSPFMFPVGVSGANYMGNTVWWKNVVTLTGNYDTDGYQYIARGGATTGPFLFNANGYPITPTTGMVVYDPTLAAGSHFQNWTGSAWASMTVQPTTWAFDFGKYLVRFAPAFSAGNPTHLSILMGANDFQSGSTNPINLLAFSNTIDTVIASYLAAVPSGKTIINLCPVGAGQDGWGINVGTGKTWAQYRLNIQSLARYLLTTYDTSAHRTAGTYIGSMMQSVDPITGYDYTNVAANIYSTGTIPKFNNYVHPNVTVGHLQMGDALAAIVQATR